MANEHKGETATGALPPVVRLLAEADKLLPEEASRPREARKGLGLACKATAKAMAKNGAQVAVSGVVSADLAVHFTLVETIDRVIEDVETLLAVVKQANFLPDAKAIEQLRKVNQQVNAQGAFDANRFERFSALAGILGGGSAGDIRRLARPS